jgi:hypothetical protein
MSGSAFRRYADGFIVGFQHETDARRLVHPRTCGALRLQLEMR